MFCPACGHLLPGPTEYCPFCGEKRIETDPQPTMVYGYPISNAAPHPSKRNTVLKIVLPIVSSILLIVLLLFSIHGIQKANLKRELSREWYSQDGVIRKVLDIDEETIEYRLETGYVWLDTTLGTYEWDAVSGNKIKVKQFGDSYRTYTIEFSETGDSMVMTPSITSLDSSEVWVCFD